MNLLKIPPKEWNIFIQRKVEKTCVSIHVDDIQMILQYAEEIPFYVQYLAYHFWEERIKNKTISSSDIMNKILTSNRYMYEEVYNRLSLSHHKALRIIAMKETKLFSENVLKQYDIKNSQLLNKALNALEEKWIIDKNEEYHFNDPIFKQFILCS